ncbi:DUF2293 domain-containing protein [Mycolicibacter longobardus]|uniref:DUF2293 domain-containing protein n=1 Tax=Mycolicibacter longobardus TaxID=1108812 RepID=UPI001F30E002|nr:DUF2293 domain-containing protein [Mycolicibacter longobardus]
MIAALKEWACTSCSGTGDLLIMDDAGPLCLHCADLGHLEFLPSGDAAMTRRAKKASRLSAVVVRWSRSRKRYERQGILVEPQAIEYAERECLSDAEVRERRRERDATRRADEDQRFIAEFADAIRVQFPGCPADRAFEPDAVRLAVVASIRHTDTDYDELLMSGVDRETARYRIFDRVEAVLDSWRSPRHPA